nr:serine carboxypeptidase [Arabidopsis thaliana]
MRNLSFIVLFLLTLFFIHHLVDASLLVKSLPGFEGPLPFELETGYVSIGESGDVELFYYFVKSERNPENDPLMIWLTGGPGCSSICGLLFANGPLAFKGDEYNGTVPPLELTSFSWTKVANILYLEAPAGSGYSYAKTRRAFESSDTKQMHQIDQFLRSWFVKHPEFISNPFYVGGDSYSGKIVPGAVQQISLVTHSYIIEQGYVLGNPVTDKNIETNYRVPFAHGMGLISDELFESLERSCGGKFFNVDPSNARCSNNLQAYDHCMSEIYSEHILLRNCKVDYVLADTPNIRTDRRRTYRYFLSAFWANDENVRRALGVKKVPTGKWNRCNSQNIPYTFEIFNAVPYHVNNSLKGFRSLIYSGDHDSMVPFSSTQAWIRALNYSIVDDWRPWMMSSNQVAGYTRTYANKMTFATIKGGGHTAEYTPDQCSLMFRRWIDGEPL